MAVYNQQTNCVSLRSSFAALALGLWLALAAGPAQAATVPTEVRFLPSPSSDVTGYRLTAEDTTTSVEAVFDIGPDYQVDPNGEAYFEVQLEERRDHSLQLYAYNGAGELSAPSNAVVVNPGPAPECAVDSECADANFCNGQEQCINGTCQNGAAVVDGTTCDDGNAGTVRDMCMAGACAGVVPECFSDATCQDISVCNGAERCVLNQCVSAAAPASDGTQCDDGDAGTVGDVCSAGSCMGAQPECFADVDCSDGNVCNGTEQCQANQCVSAAPASDGTQCDDGDAGTVADACSAGVCAGVVPECVADADCSDGELCNGAELCQANQCMSAAPADDGTLCDDGNADTVGDMCSAGVCVGEVAECLADADCSDGDLCNGAERCAEGRCISEAPAADGTQCDDGDAATANDMCSAGVCVGAVTIDTDGIAVGMRGAAVLVDFNGDVTEVVREKKAGDMRAAWCDVDGDGAKELVIGQGKGSRGELLIHYFDEVGALTDSELLETAYDGELRPACGDLDGDGRDELVVGFGPDADGRIQLFDDAASGFAPLGVGSRESGLAHPRPGAFAVTPAAGDLDGDGLDEIALTFEGSPGIVMVLDDVPAGAPALQNARLQDGVLQIDGSNSVDPDADCHPAIGDIDGDGRDELVLGFGSGGQGRVLLLDDAQTGFEHMQWLRTSRARYARQDGQTHPAVGNLDDDPADEIMIGFGPSQDGRLMLLDDATGPIRKLGKRGLDHGVYLQLETTRQQGALRPAIRD